MHRAGAASAPRATTLRGPDPYMVCADSEAYGAAEAPAAEVFRDPHEWSRRALLNIGGASRLSADDTVRQYASAIWGLQALAVEAEPAAEEA